MAEEGFIDYFKFAELDSAADRETNYKLLTEMHRKVAHGPSQKARLQTDILSQAMAIFKDPGKYEVYLQRWRQHQPTSRPEDHGAAELAAISDRLDQLQKILESERQHQPTSRPEWPRSTVENVFTWEPPLAPPPPPDLSQIIVGDWRIEFPLAPLEGAVKIKMTAQGKFWGTFSGHRVGAVLEWLERLKGSWQIFGPNSLRVDYVNSMRGTFIDTVTFDSVSPHRLEGVTGSGVREIWLRMS
jgi:hypothetical protein